MLLKLNSHAVYLIAVFVFMLISCQGEIPRSMDQNTAVKAYYVSNNGDDSNDGTINRPWKNISKIKNLILHAGDSVLFAGGQIFNGTVFINHNTMGSPGQPIVISSYGAGVATVASANETGIVINNCSYIQLQNIKVIGSGRKDGNTTNGIGIFYSKSINLENIDISGYQKSGLLIRNCSDMVVKNVYAHDNGYAGIAVDGESLAKTDCRNIEINNCKAENNPGDPTRLNNHSGNGIIVSQCTNLKISHCIATNNGWDMPRKGNGPVGIWAWEADSVTIEHCLSYRNKTSAGGEDGGGFDFDGGITNINS